MADRPPPSVLTRSEVSHLMAQPNTKALSGLRNRAMLELMYSHGLRVSELCRLQLVQVRPGEEGLYLEIRKSKRGAGRNLPVPPRAEEWLLPWLARRAELPEGAGTVVCACFTRTGVGRTEPGAPLTPRYVQQMVARYAAAAGIPKRVTPHTLRHSFATHLHQGKVPIREVQHLMGHRSLQTTMVYTHVDESELGRKVAGAL